jgi:hypothetical protein
VDEMSRISNEESLEQTFVTSFRDSNANANALQAQMFIVNCDALDVYQRESAKSSKYSCYCRYSQSTTNLIIACEFRSSGVSRIICCTSSSSLLVFYGVFSTNSRSRIYGRFRLRRK